MSIVHRSGSIDQATLAQLYECNVVSVDGVRLGTVIDLVRRDGEVVAFEVSGGGMFGVGAGHFQLPVSSHRRASMTSMCTSIATARSELARPIRTTNRERGAATAAPLVCVSVEKLASGQASFGLSTLWAEIGAVVLDLQDAPHSGLLVARNVAPEVVGASRRVDRRLSGFTRIDRDIDFEILDILVVVVVDDEGVLAAPSFLKHELHIGVRRNGDQVRAEVDIVHIDFDAFRIGDRGAGRRALGFRGRGAAGGWSGRAVGGSGDSPERTRLPSAAKAMAAIAARARSRRAGRTWDIESSPFELMAEGHGLGADPS